MFVFRLVLFMVPPSGIVFIFILGAFTLILGMALGWAWGVIAMKAALAARPAAETNAQLQALGQEAYSISNSTGQPLASVQQVLVYEGWMLDVRVTVIYFSLICLMVYLLVSYHLSLTKTNLDECQFADPPSHRHACELKIPSLSCSRSLEQLAWMSS
jgi:hypothetical protein